MTLLEFLESYLSTTLKLDKAGVAALLEADGSPKADALTQLLEKNKAHIATLNKGKTYDDGYKAAERIVKTEFEKELKEKFAVDVDKQGVELVEAIVTAKTPKGTALTDDQVKTSKPYLDLMESIPTKVQEAVKAEKAQFDSYKQLQERKETIAAVKTEFLKLFDAEKVILPADAAKAERQKNLVLKEIEAGNYRMDSGRVIMLNEKGVEEIDEQGHRKDFTAFAKSIITSTFEVAVADPKNSPGKKPGEGGSGNAKIVVKDKSDFMAQMAAAGDDAQKRADITTAYQESQVVK